MRWGLAVSAMGQTGQSDAIHSPEACASVVVRLTNPAVWSTAVVCTVAISCWPRGLRTMSKATGERGIAEAAFPIPSSVGPDGRCERLFRIDELGLRLGQGRGERSNRFTGPVHALRNSAANSAHEFELAHIDDADGLNAWPRRLGIDDMGQFAGRSHRWPQMGGAHDPHGPAVSDCPGLGGKEVLALCPMPWSASWSAPHRKLRVLLREPGNADPMNLMGASLFVLASPKAA